MNNILTRELILQSPDARTIRRKADVPEWGGHVWVHMMSASERDEFEHELFEAKKAGKDITKDSRAKMVVKSVRDDDGKLLFTDADIDALSRMHFAALDRVLDVLHLLIKEGPDKPSSQVQVSLPEQAQDA